MPSQCGGLTAGLGGATGLTGEHLHPPRYPPGGSSLPAWLAGCMSPWLVSPSGVHTRLPCGRARLHWQRHPPFHPPRFDAGCGISSTLEDATHGATIARYAAFSSASTGRR